MVQADGNTKGPKKTLGLWYSLGMQSNVINFKLLFLP
jgi:hypothetical protein